VVRRGESGVVSVLRPRRGLPGISANIQAISMRELFRFLQKFTDPTLLFHPYETKS